MLKIKLSPPTLVKRKYVVFFDSDTKKSFSSKRAATDYIIKIENELNDALLFINEFYGHVGTFYRTFYMADRDHEFKYKVQNHLEQVNLRLTYVSNHTGSENFNSIISQALNICFESLEAVCELIGAKSISRYDMLTKRRILLYGRIIKLYRASFEHFKRESIYNCNLKAKTA